MNARRFEVVIVGAGGLAQVLASAWARSKRVSVTIAARRPAAAVSAARRLGGVRSAPSIEAAVARAGTVLFAVPDRAIGPEKQRTLIRTARDFARHAEVPWEKVRFDVVNVVFSTPPVVTHFRNAFRPSSPAAA